MSHESVSVGQASLDVFRLQVGIVVKDVFHALDEGLASENNQSALIKMYGI